MPPKKVAGDKEGKSTPQRSNTSSGGGNQTKCLMCHQFKENVTGLDLWKGVKHHSSCYTCLPCSPTSLCDVCQFWQPSHWDYVSECRFKKFKKHLSKGLPGQTFKAVQRQLPWAVALLHQTMQTGPIMAKIPLNAASNPVSQGAGGSNMGPPVPPEQPPQATLLHIPDPSVMGTEVLDSINDFLSQSEHNSGGKSMPSPPQITRHTVPPTGETGGAELSQPPQGTAEPTASAPINLEQLIFNCIARSTGSLIELMETKMDAKLSNI